MEEPTTTAAAGDPASPIDIGAWIGRGQAFNLVANHCSAAQAECLARIRREGLYRSLGLTWEEFCQKHAGASRSHADHIIRRLDEFGAAYFRLAEIIPISSRSYRAIQGTVNGEALEFDGESIPITPENAPRIRRAVSALRSDLRRARDAQSESRFGISKLRERIDTWLADMSDLTRLPLGPGDRAAFVGLIGYSFDKLKKLQRSLPEE